MSGTRRHFSAAQKVQIVRRYLVDKEPVSKLVDELQIQPSLIHLWVNQVLTQAEWAFARSHGNGRVEQARERRIEQLEAKLVPKNEVIAGRMEDNIRSKEAVGEHLKGTWVPHDVRDQIVDYIAY